MPPPQHPAVKGPTTVAEMGVRGVELGKECDHMNSLLAFFFAHRFVGLIAMTGWVSFT